MRKNDGHPVEAAALALCWLPFAAIGWLLRDDPSRTAWFVSVTLFISFAHQPLTLALVYGDKRNFDLRRRVFTWSPLVLAGAVLAAQHVSLTALAIVAGLWNAEHTLMQRYGIIRIYGRTSGDQDGSLDKLLLSSWLALARVDRRRRSNGEPHRAGRHRGQGPSRPRRPGGSPPSRAR